VVVDGYAHEVSEIEVSALMEKLGRSSSGFKKPIVGVLAAPGFTPDGFNAAKNSRIIAIPLAHVFGQVVREMLELIEAVRARPIDQATEQLVQLFSFAGESPLLVDLKSLAFEALAGLYVAVQGYNSHLTIGLKAPFNQTYREADAFGVIPNGTQAYIVECKAFGRNVELEEGDVSKFFTETVPAVIRNTKEKYNIDTYRAELWTTGSVSADARAKFESIRVKQYVSKDLLDHERVMSQISNAPGLRRLGDLIRTISA